MTLTSARSTAPFAILAGIALIAWALMGGPAWAWIGVLLLVTGLVRFCPTYRLPDVSTSGTKK